jgi:hypothetical protein
MTKEEKLKSSAQYFFQHQSEILHNYKGKVVVIYLDKVLDTYESKVAAYNRAPKDHNIELGSFVIKDCSVLPENNKRVYHSNRFQ